MSGLLDEGIMSSKSKRALMMHSVAFEPGMTRDIIQVQDQSPILE